MDRASGSGVFARDPDAQLDMIQLPIKDELKKMRDSDAACIACEKWLDEHDPAWRDRIDEDDWKQRELLEQYLDYIFENFRENPLPGIRNHERACQVLQLFREGLTFREIAEKLGIKCSTAHEYFSRAINGLKANKN